MLISITEVEGQGLSGELKSSCAKDILSMRKPKKSSVYSISKSLFISQCIDVVTIILLINQCISIVMITAMLIYIY